MSDMTFTTLKIGDFCFDIPIEVIEESKSFSIECATDINKVKGGSEGEMANERNNNYQWFPRSR